MPKFHFPIIDGYKIEDPVGLELKTREQAMQVAKDIAKQIAIDVGETSARKVVVVNDEGTELYTAPIKPVD